MKHFATALLCLFVHVSLATPAAQAADAAMRPNIIFLLTDDQRDGTFGAMGHPWVKTPNVLHHDRRTPSQILGERRINGLVF